MKYTDYFPKPYPVLVTNSDTEEETKALFKKKVAGEQDRREIENLLDFKKRFRLQLQKRWIAVIKETGLTWENVFI